MIFHPTWKDRVVYLIILVVCVGLVGFCGFQVARGATSPMGSFLQPLGASSVLLVIAVLLHQTAYSAYVKVDESGLEWKDVTEKGSLPWTEIRGIGFKRYPKFVKPGLVLRTSEDLKFLPFFSPALYAVLRERVGRLPAEVERELNFHS
jgi:hypothetical protein